MYKSDRFRCLLGVKYNPPACFGSASSQQFSFSIPLSGVPILLSDGNRFFSGFRVAVYNPKFLSHMMPLLPVMKQSGGVQLAIGPSIFSCEGRYLMGFLSLSGIGPEG